MPGGSDLLLSGHVSKAKMPVVAVEKSLTLTHCIVKAFILIIPLSVLIYTFCH